MYNLLKICESFKMPRINNQMWPTDETYFLFLSSCIFMNLLVILWCTSWYSQVAITQYNSIYMKLIGVTLFEGKAEP